MTMRKSFLVLLMFMLACISLISACSNSNAPTENETKQETATATPAAQSEEEKPSPADEPLKFSFYVNYDWYSPKGLDSDAKPLNKWFRDNKKVIIEEISSNGNAAQKLGTMIASKTLPDVIQMDRNTDFDKLVEEGKLVALDEYVDKYPNLKELADAKTLNMLRSKDGKLYGIPNWFGDMNEPKTTHTGWVVNRQIHKELGSPKLETFDDLYAFLKQVKEKYPEVVPLDTANTDGGVVQVQNLIYAGMGGNRPTDFTKTDYLFAYGNLETTEFTSIFDDPAFLESYQFISKLFREKLLTQDAFSQKREQFEEKMNNGKVAIAAVYDMANAASKANDKLKANDPEAGYDYIAPIVKAGVSLDQVSTGSFGSLGWNFNSITTSAKDPEKIFAFFDWLLSPEGTTVAQYGPPGLYWEPDEKGFPNFNDKYKNATVEEKENNGIGNFYFNVQGSPRFGQLEKVVNERLGIEPNWNSKANAFWGQYVRINSDQWTNVKNFSKGSEEDLANQQIKQIMEKAVAKMVFAKSDEEVKNTMEESRKQVLGAGYQKVLDYMTKVWKDNVVKMG